MTPISRRPALPSAAPRPRRDDAALLASFNQSTRRKLRTAEKAGVTVRIGDRADLPLLYDLYRTTAQRDSFLIRPFDYYRLAWERFIDAGIAHPLIAMRDGQAIAHVILFRYGATCWYIYGASGDDQREAMPNYLLQWQAIRWARDHGCTAYDLWGAPDVFDAEDRLWGVYTFKRGFRGVVTQHIGAWDYAPNAIVYRAYTVVMPRVIAFMRARAGAAND